MSHTHDFLLISLLLKQEIPALQLLKKQYSCSGHLPHSSCLWPLSAEPGRTPGKQAWRIQSRKTCGVSGGNPPCSLPNSSPGTSQEWELALGKQEWGLALGKWPWPTLALSGGSHGKGGTILTPASCSPWLDLSYYTQRRWKSLQLKSILITLFF